MANMYNSNADFRTLSIVNADGKEGMGWYESADQAWRAGNADYQLIQPGKDFGGNMQMGSVYEHPMMNGFFDTIKEYANTAVATAKQEATSAAKTGLNKIIGGTAESVVKQPDVQKALQEKAEETVTNKLAETLKPAVTFGTENYGKILIGVGVAVAALFALTLMKK